MNFVAAEFRKHLFTSSFKRDSSVFSHTLLHSIFAMLLMSFAFRALLNSLVTELFCHSERNVME